MNIEKILADHKVWLETDRQKGERANLRSANLYGADLRSANLYGADLRSANLRSANLRSANLYGADLRSANLYGANLYGADLRSANLYGANLYGADLYGANLSDGTFIITGEKYFISITNGDFLRAGCQSHSVEDWRKFNKEQIVDMDGENALNLYPSLLDIIDFYVGKGERPEWLTKEV